MTATGEGGARVIVTQGSIRSQGRERTYVAVHPLQPPATPALVLMLHGSTQTGAEVRDFSGGVFDGPAEQNQAIVVYPDAYQGLWNDARAEMKSPARTEGVDDVAFLAALIERFGREHGTRNALAAGYSNGGQMVIRLVHEIPDRLAAAGMISAPQPTSDNFAAVDRHGPLPVVLIHGTADSVIPYEGGTASIWGRDSRGPVLSAPETARYFADRNDITAVATSEPLPHSSSGPTSVTVTRFEQADRSPVTLYSVIDGGHVIPNPRVHAPLILGRTNRAINSAQLIWDFAAPFLAVGRVG